MGRGVYGAGALPITESPEGCRMTHDIGVCPEAGTWCYFSAPNANYNCSVCCFLNSITTVTSWVFYGVMVIAVLMLIFGGFKYMTSGGNPESVKGAQQLIVAAVVGIAIALLAKVIPGVVRFFLGF